MLNVSQCRSSLNINSTINQKFSTSLKVKNHLHCIIGLLRAKSFNHCLFGLDLISETRGLFARLGGGCECGGGGRFFDDLLEGAAEASWRSLALNLGILGMDFNFFFFLATGPAVLSAGFRRFNRFFFRGMGNEISSRASLRKVFYYRKLNLWWFSTRSSFSRKLCGHVFQSDLKDKSSACT